MPYEIEATATTAATPEEIFKHLAVPEAWGEWGHFPTRARQEREGDETPYGVGCVKRVPPAREQTVVYEPFTHFAYVALAGLPVRNYRSDVRLERKGPVTLIRWQATFDRLIPGTGPLVRVGLWLMLVAFTRWLTGHAGRCDTACPAHRLVSPAA